MPSLTTVARVLTGAPAVPAGPPPRGPWWRAPVRWHAIAVLTVWAGVIVAGYRLGYALYSQDFRVHIGNAPLVGSQDVRISWRLAAAVLLAAGAVSFGPTLAARLRWPALLLASWAGAAAWAAALAAGDGLGALRAPLQARYEYLAAVDRVGSAGAFLSSFADTLATYPTHVKGHPPGFLLLLATLDGIGLGGAAVAAALVIGAGALTAPAALVAVRALADERAARAAAPFLVFTPAAVWVATSADAFFAGIAACGIALVALAACAPAGPRRAALAFVAGVVLGAALHLSYGVAPLGLVVVAVLVHRRALAAAFIAGAGVLAVTAAFVAAGFWWLDGLSATRELYHAGIATRRPYADFLVINLAAFFVALGPAALAGLSRLRDRRVWVLAGAAIATVTAAELSGLSRGETERIWLPFVPWILVATGALSGSRRWLALQVMLGLTVQATARSPW